MGSARRRRAVVSVVALLVLALFAALAASFATQTGLHARKSGSIAHVQSARLQAEGGLAWCASLIEEISIPAGQTGQEMLDTLAAGLQQRLNGTPNLSLAGVTYDGSAIVIPEIAVTAAGERFAAVVDLSDDGSVRLRVTGRKLDCVRGVQIAFQQAAGRSPAWDHGIISNGKVTMTGNASVQGANDPGEGSVLTTTYSEIEAVKLTGNVSIDGDLYVSNPDAQVSLTGNVSVGGETHGWGGDIEEHIHIGVGPVALPEPDVSIFEPFATNIVDASTNTNGNRTFTNIRIVAGTNPTFSGNIEIRGVVFIETPNRVTFSGNLDLTGVVVTEDAGEDDLDDNSIHFSGNTDIQGVECLPGPEFEQLRQLPGTFLVAPGFSTQFTGNFGTINGTMAAEEFKFAGNAGGTIHGCLINWGDRELKLVGNSHLIFDRSSMPDSPPGFLSPSTLVVIPGTYEEF